MAMVCDAKQQTAVVTGASSGIGRGVCLALAEAGANIVVNHIGEAGPARAVVPEVGERRARRWRFEPTCQSAFGDVNSPVQAWAALQVYRTDQQRTGRPDVAFLERVLHKPLPAYSDVATKFFEHVIYVASAMSQSHGGLWNEQDGAYYDVLHLPDDALVPLRIRSFVGLIPLFVVIIIDEGVVNELPDFRERLSWFVEHRAELVQGVTVDLPDPEGGRCLLAITSRDRLQRILQRVMDPSQLLADHGLRALSKEHREQPLELRVGGQLHQVTYEPGESTTGLFGGNANWRGPIWFPVNDRMVCSLREFHRFYRDSIRLPAPCAQGARVTLAEVADEVSDHLISLFLKDADGRRPVHGGEALYAPDPRSCDLILFCESFHGDSGRGIGASHQTRWTALVASLLDARRQGH